MSTATMQSAQGVSAPDSPSKRYEKMEMKLLGEGTYGEVYKVKDVVTGERNSNCHIDNNSTYGERNSI